ncbi:hypothetical protein [Winogradskyella sp.]|uniref:hypothetical protein n=1 Tax=Winogradskyella sp. TaxID=1883156 RepID=UPI0026016D51|nr:hypothetical protein [Winogradskyella sp.]
MERDNTEDLIKEIINNREITPTDKARERLIAALNSKRKEKKVIWLRYAIAASIVVTLCYVGAKMMLERINESEPTPKIVNDNKPLPIEQKPSIIKRELEAKGADSFNNVVGVQEIEKDPKPKVKVVTVKTEIKHDELPIQHKEMLASIKSELLEPKNETVFKVDSAISVLPNQFIYITAEDLLASLTTDSSSLKLNETLKKPQDKYVESEALLLEIERQRFDEKNKGIFNKARRELKKVKEALANRNYKSNENNKSNN